MKLVVDDEGQAVWRPCPVDGLPGYYLEGSGRIKAGPIMMWAMGRCGHEFTSQSYVRFGEGWRQVTPEDEEGVLCP